MRKSCKIVVIGDIGRSPRMEYHCMSLVEIGYRVDIVGYGDTEPPASLKENPHILYHYLLPIPKIPIALLHLIWKTIFQTINILFLLLLTERSGVLLVQNPPAIPTLGICWLYCKVTKCKLIIDWHNYSYTLLALSIGNNHILTRMAEYMELYFGVRSNINFCVTKAMELDLKMKNITAITLYDRPHERFQPVADEEKDNIYMELCQVNKIFHKFVVNGAPNDRRPALIVSSTSWTEDEDFSLLIDALLEYDFKCENITGSKLPEIICVITGKGPMKEYYEEKIRCLSWRRVTIITLWLKSDLYPKLLAVADLGVCLHTSSSGLDLPMKVIDMFGCCLPVCAVNFDCLGELIQHNVNGFVFETPSQLEAQISKWLTEFPKGEDFIQRNKRFKKNLREFQTIRWSNNWNAVAAQHFFS